MTYLILPPAQDDLRHIDNWIVANFGEAAADDAQRRLYETFERLARFQEMGIVRPNVTSMPVRFFASPPNWIIYEPGDPLLILRIISSRRDTRDLTL